MFEAPRGLRAGVRRRDQGPSHHVNTTCHPCTPLPQVGSRRPAIQTKRQVDRYALVSKDKETEKVSLGTPVEIP
jgi:hypothetical protein